MKELEKKILEIIKNLSKGKAQEYVAVSSIDRRVLVIAPSIIHSEKLNPLLNRLIELNFLEWKNENNSSICITAKGLEQLGD